MIISDGGDYVETLDIPVYDIVLEGLETTKEPSNEGIDGNMGYLVIVSKSRSNCAQ